MTFERPPIPLLERVKHVHLIAVCGTGMGSLAGMLKQRGLKVTGSDQNVYPPMSTQLLKHGIELREGYKPENLADRPDLVVVGNAVSKTNPEVEALLVSGIPYVSFPEALERFFIAGKTSIVVAGTHGKTTTTSLTAWLLTSAGLAPGFMIGGIARNFGHNGQAATGRYFVSEGDEYDSAFFDKEPKFLHYRPDIAVLTSVEFDHGDIYKSFQVYFEKFEKYVGMIEPTGRLIACTDYPAVRKLLPKCRGTVVTYGFEGRPQLSAVDLRPQGGGTAFTLVRDGKPEEHVFIPLTGRHNVLNAIAVIAVAEAIGLDAGQRQRAFDGFLGIARRQDLVAEVGGISIYDDFAHHPTAIAETIAALRMRHPGQRIIAVFEPRSNTSRRKVFQHDFPKALAQADMALIAPVFNAAKLADDERLDVAQIVRDIQALGKPAEAPGAVDRIVARLVEVSQPGDIVLIMSNGGFDGIHGKLAEALATRTRT